VHEACEPNAFVDLFDSEGMACQDGRDIDFLAVQADATAGCDQDAQREWSRLDLPLCQIEFASTLELIDSYVLPGRRVADIGGGPGRYTIELLRRIWGSDEQAAAISPSHGSLFARGSGRLSCCRAASSIRRAGRWKRATST
jgi:hypothetical protein